MHTQAQTQAARQILEDAIHAHGYDDGSHLRPLNNNPYLATSARRLYVDGWFKGHDDVSEGERNERA